jgi:hypothetical protein
MMRDASHKKVRQMDQSDERRIHIHPYHNYSSYERALFPSDQQA